MLVPHLASLAPRLSKCSAPKAFGSSWAETRRRPPTGQERAGSGDRQIDARGLQLTFSRWGVLPKPLGRRRSGGRQELHAEDLAEALPVHLVQVRGIVPKLPLNPPTRVG